MKRLKWLTAVLFLLVHVVVTAQEVTDTLPDSIRITRLQKELEEAKLSQANLQMEMENIRIQNEVQDSLALIARKARIDSLRKVTKGAPVVINGDTLFYVYAKRGGYTAHVSDEMDMNSIISLGMRVNTNPNSLDIELWHI